jgi:hypothetical protein
MKTLVQPIARWLVQGQKPRTFVRITDATDGAEILFAGTQAHGVYEDLIEGAGQITRSIRHEGGMAEVSGAQVDNLILDKRLPFCTEASIDPEIQNGVRGAGRLYSVSSLYASARNATTGYIGNPMIIVGRNRTGAGPYLYYTYRGFLQFKIMPTTYEALTSCEDAYIQLTGVGDFSLTDFTIYGMGGLWTDLRTNPAAPATSGGQIINDFTGWAASGDYNVASNWIETWTTAEFGGTVYLRLNAAGRSAIVAAAGTADKIFRIMLISHRDADWDVAAPTGAEYVNFSAEDPKLVLRYNSVKLDNQPSAIYLAVDPLPATHADMDLVWTGVVDNYEITDRTLSVTMRQNDHKKNRMIPDGIIDATGIFAGCDESIIGKAIPIVYGDFMTNALNKQGVAYVANEDDQAIQYAYKDYVKGYIYQNNEDGVLKIQISSNANKTLDNILVDYVSGIKSFAIIAGDVADEGTDKKTISSTRNSTVKFPYDVVSNNLHSLICYTNFEYDTIEGGVTNAGDCIDEDPTNFSSFAAGDYKYYYPGSSAVFPAFGVTDVYLFGYVCINTYATAGYDAGFKIIINDLMAGGEPAIVDQIINTDGWHYYKVTPSSTTNMASLAYRVAVSNIAGSKTIKVYGLCLCFGHHKRFIGEVYTAVKGCPDDSSGTVTGTPALLIENPSHIIESIARAEMLLTTAEIDTAAFDTAAAALTGKKLAFQILDRTLSRELLDDLGLQSRLKIWWDDEDKLTCKMFNAAAYFPVSVTDVPGLLDMFTTTGLPVAGSFTTHQIIEGPKLWPMKNDEVKNDIIINYCMNYATGEYSKVLRVNKDEENIDETICIALGTTGAALKQLCIDSYAAVQTVNALEIDAWAIRDDTTATALIKHLVEQLSVRRWNIEFTAGPSAVLFEESDFINVRDGLIADRFGTAAMNVKKWEILGYDTDPISHDVTIRAIEV